MSLHHDIRPPHWPLRLLRFFLKKAYLEEVEGDMEELFYDHVDAYGVRKARMLYTIEMLKLFRPILIRNFSWLQTTNTGAMFRNYFKVSFRGLMKSPMNAFINIFGLSVAIGVCILVFTFMQMDRNIDQFHQHKNEVFLITYTKSIDGAVQQYGMSPRPLGEILKGVASIRKTCRVEDGNVVMKFEDNVFDEQVRYVDPTFLEMFTFPLQLGDAASLKDVNSIILSHDMAVKYFGDENPIGKDMLMIFDEHKSKVFKVTGVAEPFPKAHAIEFRFLVNFENIHTADPSYDVNNWREFVNATLVQLNDAANKHVVADQIQRYKALQNEANHELAIENFVLEPLATLHEKSSVIKDDISYDDNIEARIGLPVIAIFMIVLACLNYINIAIVTATKRLKEIGVRKVIGASRTKVIVQFLSENILITCFALVTGFLLALGVFNPWFSSFSGWPLDLDFSDKRFWIFLCAVLLLTGIASGMYPAFYISRFEAVRIFKGSVQFGKKNPLTKVFLGVQLILACITITAAVVFTQNNAYQNNLSWGYNQKETLFVKVPGRAGFEKLRAVMEQNPHVVSLAGSEDHLGKKMSVGVVTLNGKQYETELLAVQPRYFETMELPIKSGRAFIEDAESEKKSAIVNEILVDNLGLTSPLGATLEMDSIKYEIVGIVDEFHTRDFFVEMRPAIFTVANPEDYQYLTMRVEAGAENDVADALQKHWQALFPELPFLGGHQEEVWTGYFFSVNRSEQFNKVIASIAVLLACLGFYGLVTINVAGRTREFSIRKTLGAGVQSLTAIVLNQYVWLTGIALIIGAPISYIFTQAYLKMLFAYPMPMGYSGIIMSVIILIAILLIVVSTQIRKVLKANPVEGLKTE